MIDDQELRAIHFLALRVRKATSGAGPWDADGLMSNLRKIADRNLHLTIEHVLRHAADPNAKTPGVLAGSYTPVAPTPTRRTSPPKRTEECRTHIGQYADNCGGCRSDQLAESDYPEESAMNPTHLTGAAMVRAAMREGGES